MFLIDTSVWIDHLRVHDRTLAGLLEMSSALGHPFVLGEIALGNLRSRKPVISALARLPQATIATDTEVIGLIEQEQLAGCGIGYIDAHLLASARLTPGTYLFTRDRKLAAVAARMNLLGPENLN